MEEGTVVTGSSCHFGNCYLWCITIGEEFGEESTTNTVTRPWVTATCVSCINFHVSLPLRRNQEVCTSISSGCLTIVDKRKNGLLRSTALTVVTHEEHLVSRPLALTCCPKLVRTIDNLLCIFFSVIPTGSACIDLCIDIHTGEKQISCILVGTTITLVLACACHWRLHLSESTLGRCFSKHYRRVVHSIDCNSLTKKLCLNPVEEVSTGNLVSI